MLFNKPLFLIVNGTSEASTKRDSSSDDEDYSGLALLSSFS